MKVTLIQADLIWENPIENRKLLGEKIREAPLDTDLIVLPEMFTTGFSMQPEFIAESMDGITLTWLKELAQSRNCALTGSLVIAENNAYYNRLVFVFPTGEIRHYDKRHLFSLAGEHKIYTKGTRRMIIDFKGFRICPLVCYDLRFPVFSRNTENYDVLLYVANWPEPRIQAWDTLLKARAIENVSYVIGVNRIGQDANGHHYPGHSQAVDPLGNYLISAQDKAGIFNVELDKHALLETRQKFGFLNDRDAVTVI